MIVGWSTRNRFLLPRPINDRMARAAPRETGWEWRSSHPRMARIRSLRTQWARHRVDHGAICGRSCANSRHYKLLCACVDRTFINRNASGRRPENLKPAPRRDTEGGKLRRRKPCRNSRSWSEPARLQAATKACPSHCPRMAIPPSWVDPAPTMPIAIGRRP